MNRLRRSDGRRGGSLVVVDERTTWAGRLPPIQAILGDSLPAGRHCFAVSSPLETFPDRRDALFVPAGCVDLAP